MQIKPQNPPSVGRVPLEVIALGIVSFLTDVSSETIFAVLPIYFVAMIGGSTIALGVMEGLADFASSSLDLASGRVSDRTGKRKWLVTFGYALSTLAKSILLLATTAGGVMAFRVIERLGKSIRGAPRDALLAAIAPQKSRGLAFGVHKALDKAGAVVGPMLAYLVLDRFGSTPGTFHGLFLAALIPAVIAVVVLAVFVKDRPVVVKRRVSVRDTLTSLGPRYRAYLAATALFSLGYFSFVFLMLKAQTVGFEVKHQALLYGLFNLVFTIVSIPIGWLGDRVGRRPIVIASYLLYAGMAAGLMLADSPAAVVAMFVIYGVFYAMDEGQAKAYLADLSADENRATAIGIYGFVTGLAYLPASLIAGWLWSYGPHWTFAFAVGTSLTALAYFLLTATSVPVRAAQR
ncbi:MAG TPA: MFS transporter [Pirellulaceae bacterium]|nr:MFS transporter [Pirellulaceae bacterium]